MLLIYLSGAWVAGIFLGSNYNLPLAFSLAGIMPLVLLFFTRRYRRLIIVAALGICILVAAASYAYSSLHTVNENSIHFYNGCGSVDVKGMVAAAPDVRDRSVQIKLAASEINLDSGWRGAGGTVLVFLPRYPEYKYGDVLHVTGELETPSQLDDFDYQGYLAHQGIYATMFYPKVEVLVTGQGFKPLAWVYSLRGRLAQNLTRVLPEPQASLAQGIVLGIRSNIPESLKSDFSRSGTAHLLAISGINLTIMAGILLGVGLWLFGRRHHLYVWLTLGVIWVYTIIAGMNPPVVRGAIMVSLFLVAEFLGRQRSAMVALALAAAVMSGINPYVLGDASFQLSFLAMAGLIFITPVFQAPGRRAVAAVLGDEGTVVSMANVAIDSLSTTLGAVIAVWPVVAYYFGMVSLVGPLATFLALPAMPGVIVTVTLAAILGLVALPVAQLAGWVAWLFLSYTMVVVSGLAAPSVSSVEVNSISTTFMCIYYPALAAGLWLVNYLRKLPSLVPAAAKRRRSRVSASRDISRSKIWVVSLLVVVAVPVSYTAATMPDGDLHVSFLDVGEGDAVLIQKGSQQVLIDGGPSPQALTLELGRKMPFWDRSIDMVVLTHPHNDHLAGLLEILRRYQVGQVCSPDYDYESPVYAEWSSIIKEKDIEQTIARAGQRINLGNGVIVDVLGPQSSLMSGTESDMDNNSLVMRLSDGKISFLFTADIMREAEWALMGERADLASTVIKVAHHGSETSTCAEFLAVVNPQAAVISAGAGNKFGHPSPEVLERLEGKTGQGNTYRTDQQGTIEFVTDGESLRVETAR